MQGLSRACRSLLTDDARLLLEQRVRSLQALPGTTARAPAAWKVSELEPKREGGSAPRQS